MVTMTFDADIKSATKWLDNVGKKQIPFATSTALNKTAWNVRAREQKTMAVDLSSPTPGVLKSIRVKMSSKRKLQARVFIIPPIAKFLIYQVEGGKRPPRGKVEAIPVNIRLNKYGNIIGRKAGKLAKLLTQPTIFSGRFGGTAGIWEKMPSGRLKLLVVYGGYTAYKKRWPFYRYAIAEVNRRWIPNFDKSLAFALRTAR